MIIEGYRIQIIMLKDGFISEIIKPTIGEALEYVKQHMHEVSDFYIITITLKQLQNGNK